VRKLEIGGHRIAPELTIATTGAPPSRSYADGDLLGARRCGHQNETNRE
jgi:hypothetical protein